MNLDTKIFFILHDFGHKSLRRERALMYFGSYLAYPLAAAFPAYLLAVQAPLADILSLSLGALVAALLARFGFGSLIRFFHPVPRPFLKHSLAPFIQLKSPSFPSGHALFFFALSAFVFFFNPYLGSVFFFLTTLIAVARVAGGVHYPSDMLGGMLIGIVSAYLSYSYILPLLARLF